MGLFSESAEKVALRSSCGDLLVYVTVVGLAATTSLTVDLTDPPPIPAGVT